MFSLTTVDGSNECFTLALTGAVSEGVLPEIECSIHTGGQNHAKIRIDLSEVTLIDRVSARFFAEQLHRGVELIDCPPYLQHWIFKEVIHEQNR